MRGRALFSNDSRIRQRASSVPAEHLRFSDDAPEIESRHHVFGIASRAAQDADDITTKSRQHDRDFLRNMNAKLSGFNGVVHNGPTVFLSNPPPAVSTGAYLLYPPTQSYSMQKRVSTAPPVVDSRRRTWVAPSYAPPVDDYEVTSYLSAAPCRPYVRSSVALRAGSVPPVLPSRASVPRWFPSSPVVTREMGYRPSYRWNPSEDVSSKAAMEDIVVGVAHTSLYGDIVIGIPYKKRFMFNVQHGMDEVQDNGLPRIPVNLATRVTSSSGGIIRDGPNYNHFAKSVYRPLADYSYTRPLTNHLLTTGTPNIVTRRASYSGPTNVASRNPHFYSPYYNADSNGIHDSDLLSTSYSYGNKSSHLPLSGKIYDDYDVDEYLSRQHGNNHLRVTGRSRSEHNPRTLTRVGQDRMNDNKSVLDRYLLTPVVSSTPATSSGPQARSYTKPPISEARQKVRNLLCKSKGDPRYFED